MHQPSDILHFEEMARLLESSGRYRVLRRLEPRLEFGRPDGRDVRRGVFVDVETTGLDPSVDEIIEIAMVPFDFSSDGEIFATHEPFNRFRDPGCPIPVAVTAITGITDEMVKGQTINPAEIESFLGSTVLVVAHNAGFDRRFLERFSDAFVHLSWACSWSEIDWKSEGFEGSKLQQLASELGFFFDGHRAVIDCQAGIEILARKLPKSGRRALDALLTSARMPRWRVWATQSPFELKDHLKKRGYRWDDGSAGRARAWYIDVTDEKLAGELLFLRTEIYGRDDFYVERRRVDAFDRYSDRC
jgi:DNA polymerase-3 subunit epsilon